MKLTKRLVVMIGCLGFLIANAGHAAAKSHAGGKKTSGYAQTNLISDIPGLAEVTDPNLLNPWGLAFFPGLSPFWINENNAGFSALYFADAVPFPGLPLVTIPPPSPSYRPVEHRPESSPTSLPVTGVFPIVPVSDPTETSVQSLFIFDTEDGTIEAWNQTVPDILSAVIVVDNSAGGGPTGAVYKGLALGVNAANGPLLYATNFRTGKSTSSTAIFNRRRRL